MKLNSEKNMLNVNLDSFKVIGLKDMERVKLMNRVDSKYTFSVGQLPSIILQLEPYYYVVEIANKKWSTYETLYYDTSDYKLYHKHQNGALNRYKIRHRTYVDSQLGFLEVKFKNNKGRTNKERIKASVVPYSWDENQFGFLEEELNFDPQTLQPVLWINYKRLTLVNKISAERVTIDVSMEFIKDGVSQVLNNLVIAEVKQEKKQNSPFVKVMKALRLREGSISKYCMGVCCTHTDIKRNNFKEKLINLKHLV